MPCVASNPHARGTAVGPTAACLHNAQGRQPALAPSAATFRVPPRAAAANVRIGTSECTRVCAVRLVPARGIVFILVRV